MTFNYTDLKTYRVLIILFLSIALLSSITFVAAAATTYDFQDPEGKYTFKFTFPNEDIVECDPAFHVEDWGEHIKFSVNQGPENEDGVEVIIEVEGADVKEWRLIQRGYPIKDRSNSTNEFALFYASSDCPQIRFCGESARYNIAVSSQAPKGSAGLKFVLVAVEDNEDDFFIVPAYEEIKYGETIDFTLKKERNGIYSDVSNRDVEWGVTQSKSISNFISDGIVIGTIDNAGVFNSNGGTFTSQEIGSCTVYARMDDDIVAKAEVDVKCPCDDEGDLQEIIRLYKLRIAEGPYHRDLKAGKISFPYSSMNPGYANNLYAAMNYTEYGEFTCGAYQSYVLEFLSIMQSTPEECHLLNGYDFGPIEGSYAGHHAVVVYPKGTDWKKTGIVFDPWYNQKPEVMDINVWEDVFSPIAGDTSPTYRNDYNTTKDPNDYKYALWPATEELILRTSALIGFGQCPVNILITDSSGRQMGAVDDDEIVSDIPGGYLLRMADEEGGYLWYFTLPATDEYDVDITAFDDGDFDFVVVNSNTEQVQLYGEHPIEKGEATEVELSSEDPTAPMILPDKSEVIPTLEVLEVPEISTPGTAAKKGEISGFELFTTVFVIFAIMLFRRT
ncbi:hypothetical protein J2755_000947 [Methanohalophilus levihalophilus]|uniref:hypothetical protein n=1 Tax=Methanohalophilus levihalophilus TaxID=1431282 RepID=UPI001AE25776|nr:hypothetical protein [Methanohalophilus levihalophilus]MBP2030013.1 hypothetical protein [Methanohalophilus levihalophilus]